MKTISHERHVEILGDIIRLMRDVTRESCVEGFELLHWRDKFSIEEAIRAVDAAVNGLSERLIADYCGK